MMPLPLKSLFSPHFAIRCAEVALVVALALALANMAWLLLPAGGEQEQPATGAAGRGGAGASLMAATGGGVAASRKLSPALLGLFGRPADDGPAIGFPEGELRETDLDLTLKGILARRGGGHRLALVAQGDATEKVYRVGDRIAGAEITHIEARRVVLLHNGASEALTLNTAEPRRGNNFDNGRPGLLRDGQEVTVDYSIQ